MLTWMLTLTHPFLMQRSTSLSSPRDLKNHFFKLSGYSSAKLVFFTRFYCIIFPITLIFIKALYLGFFFFLVFWVNQSALNSWHLIILFSTYSWMCKNCILDFPEKIRSIVRISQREVLSAAGGFQWGTVKPPNGM